MRIGIYSDFTGSGKDECAKFLIEVYNFKRFAFADPLKEDLKILLGREINKKTDRSLMQNYGELRRNEYLNHWVDKLIKNINQSDAENIVVTDIRYMNEIQELIQNNFLLLKIQCNESKRRENLFLRDGFYDPSIEQHNSQKELQLNSEILNPISFKLMNNFDSTFYKDISKFIESLQKNVRELKI